MLIAPEGDKQIRWENVTFLSRVHTLFHFRCPGVCADCRRRPQALDCHVLDLCVRLGKKDDTVPLPRCSWSGDAPLLKMALNSATGQANAWHHLFELWVVVDATDVCWTPDLHCSVERPVVCWFAFCPVANLVVCWLALSCPFSITVIRERYCGLLTTFSTIASNVFGASPIDGLFDLKSFLQKGKKPQRNYGIKKIHVLRIVNRVFAPKLKTLNIFSLLPPGNIYFAPIHIVM